MTSGAGSARPTASRTARGLSRRTAVGGLATLTAALVTGCTADRPSPPPTGPAAPTGTPPPEPDVALAMAVLRDEQAMLDRLLATLRKHPRLAGTVAGARAAHRAHIDLLAEAVPAGVASHGPARRRTPPVADGPAAALAALVRAEDRLAAQDRRSALTAESGALARVLASMAAAAAQQAVQVAGAGGDRP